MARRFSAPYQTEPVSGLATWSRNLAVFSVVTVLVSVIIVRFGFLEMKPALATFFGGLGIAGLSILFGLAGFAAIWQNGSRGMARILLALLIDAVILAYPAYLGLQYRKLPQIHDITTDPIDPPRFEAVARTPIMGFREDVSIRVVADGDDSRVDIRSASRYFDSDLGSNAARVTKFIDDLNTAADAGALKPVKKTPVPPAKAPAKTVKK